MRISLLVGSTLHPLAGEAGVSERVHSSAADFVHTADIAVQPGSKVRAAFSSETDRNNLLTSISFSTTRKFPTASRAFLYDLDYDRTMPRTGIIVLEAISADGDASVRHLLNALVRPPRRKVTGCTVFLDYSITGGEIIFISDAEIPDGAILGEDSLPLLAEDGSYILTES